MPITPFHFGPGALLQAVAPRQVSFLAFCAANLLIDLESLYNLLQRRQQVHAFLHTYSGASLAAALVVLFFWACHRIDTRRWIPNLLGWRQLTLGQVALGAVLGAWSHVVFDSIMHADIQPLMPFSPHNALLGLVSLEALHGACVALGGLALLVHATRWFLMGVDDAP